MILEIYTIIHTLISLVAIFTGFVVVFGMFAGKQHLAGPWRWIYVIGGVICLYFNLFVAVVQVFEKIPALHVLAPTQTEAPFKLTQLVVLLVVALLAIVAPIRFHPEPICTA